ncbi:MAG: phosphatidylglycerophosphatase A [Rhodoferax sp.]|uniref:phosphatidylglycerophosphatase A family protein n=1 Tax=Rhodoferax sp. TaxID=50421 RepID=UPI0013FEA9B9|nr:phosphatidylglycerophosphatase A [Rhodoferax sp.]NDP38389.1 phosphatidylglycerophosphatase A [Rhodoferax sp.]
MPADAPFFEPPIAASPVTSGPLRPSPRFMWSHPAHLLALGFGSGLSPLAPGTAGTLWAWLAFFVMQPWMNDTRWAWLIALSLPLGWWACTLTAKNMRVLDPSSIVWDEIAAFWLVLWLVTPAGFWGQLVAFGLFRFFDAAKPGPVRWADQLFHGVNTASDPAAWRKAGFGIMFDDLVAAACTLLVIAGWRFYQ